uniref:Uncharacterized protein n=1 Tax=Timema poppense TaxID=170557 RepID=A0A7R9CIK9_TIMPO|nr:unnamed protein product [Timema poppensis]
MELASFVFDAGPFHSGLAAFFDSDDIEVSGEDLPTSLSKHPPKMKLHKEERDTQHQPLSSKAPYLTVQSTLDESLGILAAHRERGVFEMEKDHTAEYISSIILNILQECGLKREMLHLVVKNGAANMVKTIDIAFGKKKHICFAHLLSLGSYRFVEAVPELDLLIDKELKPGLVSEVLLVLVCVCGFERSGARPRPGHLGYGGFIPILNIIHCHTSAPIMRSAAEDRDLKEVVQLLEPLQAATNQVSGDKFPTVSLVIDACAFRVYGHWVKKGEGQNRAALFENMPKTELKYIYVNKLSR